MCSTPHAPAACRYSPLDSCQASRSPKSPLRAGLRGGVSAFGRAPLTGTSQSCWAARPGGAQDARTVPPFHQRNGEQVLALVPGTGSCLISEPRLLTSLMPWLVPAAKSVPDGAYSAPPEPSDCTSRPDRLYRATMVLLPDSRVPAMFRPCGVVYPIGVALPCMTNVLIRPVARVSCPAPPLPEKTWNSARLPSGDQATSSGADRKSGHRASRYLAPPGLIR